MSELPLPRVPFREALAAWARIACLSFGGPAGQIAVMHRILVEEKRWLDEARFLHALNFCLLLPGPEAQQLATYSGWLLHGTRGALVAGSLFVLPGFLSILLLSVLYARWGSLGWVEGLFFGLKAAVLAVVLGALLRLAPRALRTPALRLLAVAAFAALFVFQVAFPWIVVGAALAGLVGSRLAPGAFLRDAGEVALSDSAPTAAQAERPSPLRSLGLLSGGLALWLGPVAALVALRGGDDVLARMGVFFSKVAVVTFGGAYAVLAYVAQQAVEAEGWLQPGEMLDGLGLAETTPGPLIQVVQFVGFLGAWRSPGALSPLAAGVAASLLVTWVTFAPCFLWILLGAPYVERLRRVRALAALLAAISAAVVGVIANLALWFALHALFGEVSELRWGPLRLLVPEPGSLDTPALVLALAAGVAHLRLKVGMLPTIASCAAVGAAWRLLG